MQPHEIHYGITVTFIGERPKTLIGKEGMVVGHARWSWRGNDWVRKVRVRFPGYTNYRLVLPEDLSLTPPHREW